MAPGVSDEVWRRLDPGAGALSRRTVVRNWAAIVVAVVVVVTGIGVWRSGVVVPQLVWPNDHRAWALNVNGRAYIELVVSNAGWTPVTVLDVGRSAPGFELLRVHGGGDLSVNDDGELENPQPSPLPVTLPPGTGVVVILAYRVSDCDSPPTGAWPVTAQVERPWGVMTVEVADDPSHDPWQEKVVDLWCDPQAWSID